MAEGALQGGLDVWVDAPFLDDGAAQGDHRFHRIDLLGTAAGAGVTGGAIPQLFAPFQIEAIAGNQQAVDQMRGLSLVLIAIGQPPCISRTGCRQTIRILGQIGGSQFEAYMAPVCRCVLSLGEDNAKIEDFAWLATTLPFQPTDHRSGGSSFGVRHRIWNIFRSLAATRQENSRHIAFDGAQLGMFLQEDSRPRRAPD